MPELESSPAPPSRSRIPGAAAGSRRRARAAVAAGSVLLLTAAGLGVLRSPLFGADRRTVEGAHRLSAERVLSIAGIAEGENVVWLDEAEAERRLAADPWIAEAHVVSDLPDAIAVRIIERVPVGAVETHSGWEVVAADGVILATTTDAPGLPTITAAVPGDDLVTLCARLLGAMPPALRNEVENLTVGVDGLVRLALIGGIPVTYGDTAEAVEKAQALAAVLAWAEQERADVREIDVSVPGAPTARLADGAVATP